MAPDADPLDKMSERCVRESLDLLCGRLLGQGIGRAVYELRFDPTRVIKIESAGGSFQNVTEWQTWQNLAHTDYAKFLAPCDDISSSGIALIQKRVRPLPSKADEQAAGVRSLLARCRVPDFLTDFKRENYGILDGRIVCCDYGSNLLLNHGAFACKLGKPEWAE